MTYLRNGWYCAGFSHELTDKPCALTIMDEPVVMYRQTDGRAVALADKCPHRFAPLSLGKVCGDHIECPYHGLRFNHTGACTFNPHGNRVIPKAAQVRTYPLVERDTILWIWMGDPALADSTSVANLTDFFGLQTHSIVYGNYKLHAHYELVLDNLMDLSHAPYLHAGSLSNGAQDAAAMRFEMKQDGNSVTAFHLIDNCEPSPQFRPFWRSAASTGDFRANMHWSPPCTLLLDVGATEKGRPVEEGPYLHTAHLLTPVSARETHYFWAAARNSAVGNEVVGQMIQAGIHKAFTTEDEPMIDAVQERMGTIDLFALKPVLLPGDAAAMRVRRILEQLRQAEAKASQT